MLTCPDKFSLSCERNNPAKKPLFLKRNDRGQVEVTLPSRVCQETRRSSQSSRARFMTRRLSRGLCELDTSLLTIDVLFKLNYSSSPDSIKLSCSLFHRNYHRTNHNHARFPFSMIAGIRTQDGEFVSEHSDFSIVFFLRFAQMLARYKRALSEPIDFAMIESGELFDGSDIFEVNGSTGNIYQVTIKRETMSECTCADCTIRKKMCKHVMCILIKAYGLNINQLKELEKNEHLGLIDVPINTSIIIDACECPICFNNLETEEWKCQQCKKNFHMICITDWFTILRRQNMNLSCPHCRHTL